VIQEALPSSGRVRRISIGLGLLLGVPGALGAWHGWVNRDRSPKTQVAPKVLFKREDPSPGVIHVWVSGEGYPLGFAQGTALRAEIREMARYLNEDLLGKGLLGTGSRDWLLASAWKLDACMAQRFREELRGMADASGVSYSDLLLINTFDDLKNIGGCSTIVAMGDDRHPLLHGRNLDYPIPKLAKVKLVRDIETRGIRIRIFGFPGFIGVLTGMSSQGLGLSSHTSASRQTQSGEPTGLLYRRVLEESTTLEEMEAALTKARRTMGNNLAISDGKRQQAIALEFDADSLAARKPVNGRLTVTNHFWIPALQAHQNEGWWAPSSGSQSRVACLSHSVPDGTICTEKQIQDALSEEGPGKTWRTPANAGTVQSVIMEPATGRAWMACGQRIPVTRGTYLEMNAAWGKAE